MTHRITTFSTALALGGLLLFLTVVFGSANAYATARAAGADGYGAGYTSSTGWWLGSYSLDDGSRGFCLQAGLPSPVGHTTEYVDGDSLGWFTAEQSAQLAYVSRNWAATDDRSTAAAGQIATWMIAGLNGQSPEFYAARAGADAPAVLARANEMVAESAREASRSVTAETHLTLTDQGRGAVDVDLSVDRLSGTVLLPPSTHTGVVELVDARFEDGSTTAPIGNGTALSVVPTGTEPAVTVSATAEFSNLPYGDRIRVAVAHDQVQALLVAVPASATASAGAETDGVSPLPFQPEVQTTTSTPQARPGAALSDHLTVGVSLGSGLLPHWGVTLADDGATPETVGAIVESSLLGPFEKEIVPADVPPADAPVVCTVEVPISGPGEYDTPECTLAADGYYVWVERIDPARTDPDGGGSRMLPWSSSFGAASEITRVTTDAPAPAIKPALSKLAETGLDIGKILGGGGAALILGTVLIARAMRRPTLRPSSQSSATEWRHADA